MASEGRDDHSPPASRSIVFRVVERGRQVSTSEHSKISEISYRQKKPSLTFQCLQSFLNGLLVRWVRICVSAIWRTEGRERTDKDERSEGSLEIDRNDKIDIRRGGA